MNTLQFIIKKFNLVANEKVKMPIEIPNFGRNQLAELFKELNFNHGVEIGVRDGEYSDILCKANPNLYLIGIDPYTAYNDYSDIRLKITFNNYYETAKKRLEPFKDRYALVTKFSQEAVLSFPDQSLDFVYIDGNHEFYYVAADIHFWSKKIKKGGIIAGHDYFKHDITQNNCHVYQVVNGYTDSHFIRPWFVLGSKAYIKGEVRDKPRSWMWII